MERRTDVPWNHAPIGVKYSKHGKKGFLAWVIESGKKFIIVANKNHIANKEVFPLLKAGLMWMGPAFPGGNAFFRLPEDFERGRDFAGGVYDERTGMVKFRNIGWFTNVDHGLRHKPLPLDTMRHNLKYNKKLQRKLREKYHTDKYPTYDNYDAIEVPLVDSIPSDYDGIMGVPMEFMDSFNPDQFEILGRRGDLAWATTECDFFTPPPPELQAKYKAANSTWRVQNTYVLREDDKVPEITYGRIFIRRKKGGEA